MAWSGYILDVVAVAGFELGRAEISQAAVQSGAVVPADVLGDGAAGTGLGGPGLQVEQLAFPLRQPQARRDPGPQRVPQAHPPGAEAEVDFGEFHAMIAGTLIKLWMFVLRLSEACRPTCRPSLVTPLSNSTSRRRRWLWSGMWST